MHGVLPALSIFAGHWAIVSFGTTNRPISSETTAMNSKPGHSTTGTVIYGLLIIVPIAILFLLLVKLTEILEKLAVPLGMESSFGAAIALVIIIIVAISGILLVSWIMGAIMRRIVSYEKFETALLNEIPGYQIVASVARGFAEGETSYAAALVELHGPGAAALGFIMDEHADGRVTVYIPSVPVLTVGNIFVVERERITLLEASAREVADSIAKWGTGSEHIFAAAKTTPESGQ